MNYENPTFSTADWARREIKHDAAIGDYDSQQFRACVDVLRDGMITLARDLEFGKLEKLIDYSKRLLEHQAGNGRWELHKLKPDDLLYFIQTFPTPAAQLQNDISADFRRNAAIIDSVVKSETYDKEGTILDFCEMAHALATLNDSNSWLKLVMSNPNAVKRLKIAMFSLSAFDPDFLKAHRDEFSEFAADLKAHYAPNDFAWKTGDVTIDPDALFSALKTLGCDETIQKVLKVCWLMFKEPFTLQHTMQTYGLTPDADYRKHLAKSAHASDMNTAATVHLATSYYLYELSIPDDLPLCKSPISLKTVLEVLALNAAETPYGIFDYLPRKVGQFLDNMLHLATTAPKADAHKVIKEYQDAIPEKTLMLSRFYRGHQLSNAMGL